MRWATPISAGGVQVDDVVRAQTLSAIKQEVPAAANDLAVCNLVDAAVVERKPGGFLVAVPAARGLARGDVVPPPHRAQMVHHAVEVVQGPVELVAVERAAQDP